MRPRLGSERGMTLIEISVTLLVISLGTLATLGTYTHFAKATRTARERAILISVAQREMETLRPITFTKLGLTTAPSAQAAVEAPLGAPASSETLVTGNGGVVQPGGDSFTYRGAQGRIYRYITSRPVDCGDLTAKVHGQLSTLLGQTTAAIQASIPNLCGAATVTKRITVVVVPTDDSGATARGVRLATVVQDPSSVTPVAVNTAGLALKKVTGAVVATPTPAAEAVTQTVSLTDTRCSNGARQTPVSHTARDTAQASWTCSASGPAPTLMTLGGIGGSSSDPVPDFSTDVTRAATGGLAMLRDDRAGSCSTPSSQLVYSNAEATPRRYSVHKWVTTVPAAPMETPDSNGRASLSLWSSTADGKSAPGRLCVTLQTDDGVLLGSADFTLATWPSRPTQLSTAFDLAHKAIPAGARLVLTVRVPSDSGSDIRVLYDHASYQSALSFTMKTGKTLQ